MLLLCVKAENARCGPGCMGLPYLLPLQGWVVRDGGGEWEGSEMLSRDLFTQLRSERASNYHSTNVSCSFSIFYLMESKQPIQHQKRI